MVEYFTEPYWEELADRLNDDESFREGASDLSTEMLFVADDKDQAFLIRFEDGQASIEAADQEADAEFKFIGPYDEWVKNHKGEADLQRLIMTGKIKFKGNMGRVMSIRKQLGSVGETASEIDAEY